MVKFDDETDFMNVLVGGPWLVFGHYVVIKPWSPSFNPATDVVTTTPAWIRLIDLQVVYYEENVLLQLASAVDTPLKVDHRTLYANRGRFARICVELDLTKSLKGVVVINGARTLIEYEGLHTICFRCGHFGHFQTSCPQDPAVMARLEETTKKNGLKNQGSPEITETTFGSWMNPNRRRVASQGKQKVMATSTENPTPEVVGLKPNKNRGVASALLGKGKQAMAPAPAEVKRTLEEEVGRKLELSKEEKERAAALAMRNKKRNARRKSSRKNCANGPFTPKVSPLPLSDLGPGKRARVVFEPTLFDQATLTQLGIIPNQPPAPDNLATVGVNSQPPDPKKDDNSESCSAAISPSPMEEGLAHQTPKNDASMEEAQGELSEMVVSDGVSN
ncbi:hypothetical protein V2J09_003312 [Rumex salicifolius]